MTSKSENGKITRNMIRVVVKKPSNSKNEAWVFLVSIADAISSSTYERLSEAERFYNRSQQKWLDLASQIKKNKSNAILKWKLGRDIGQTMKIIEKRWAIEITNIVGAVAELLGTSRSFIRYCMRASERIRLKDLEKMRINWSKIQEVLDITDDAKMLECLNLIIEGKITKDSEIREFKKKCRSEAAQKKNGNFKRKIFQA